MWSCIGKVPLLFAVELLCDGDLEIIAVPFLSVLKVFRELLLLQLSYGGWPEYHKYEARKAAFCSTVCAWFTACDIHATCSLTVIELVRFKDPRRNMSCGSHLTMISNNSFTLYGSSHLHLAFLSHDLGKNVLVSFASPKRDQRVRPQSSHHLKSSPN